MAAKPLVTPEVKSLTDFCELIYGVPAMETRILISSLLPTRYPPVWILIQSEQNRFLDHLAYVLRQIRALDVWDTWQLRAERPRAHNRSVMIHLASRDKEPRFFADRYWRLPGPTIWRQSRYPLLAQECVRMRHQFDPVKYPELPRRNELHELICRALAAARQDRGGVVPIEPSAPYIEAFKRRVNIVSLTDSLLTNRTALMRNLCYVPTNHAALCGRETIDEIDLRAQAHILRSTIPFWMEKLLSAFLSHNPMTSITLTAAIQGTGFEDSWRNVGTQRDPRRLCEKLVNDLWSSGLLEKTKWGRSVGRYKVKAEYVDDLEHIINAQL